MTSPRVARTSQRVSWSTFLSVVLNFLKLAAMKAVGAIRALLKYGPLKLVKHLMMGAFGAVFIPLLAYLLLLVSLVRAAVDEFANDLGRAFLGPVFEPKSFIGEHAVGFYAVMALLGGGLGLLESIAEDRRKNGKSMPWDAPVASIKAFGGKVSDWIEDWFKGGVIGAVLLASVVFGIFLVRARYDLPALDWILRPAFQMSDWVMHRLGNSSTDPIEGFPFRVLLGLCVMGFGLGLTIQLWRKITNAFGWSSLAIIGGTIGLAAAAASRGKLLAVGLWWIAVGGFILIANWNYAFEEFKPEDATGHWIVVAIFVAVGLYFLFARGLGPAWNAVSSSPKLTEDDLALGRGGLADEDEAARAARGGRR